MFALLAIESQAAIQNLWFQEMFIDCGRVICLETEEDVDATFYNGRSNIISIAFVMYLTENRGNEMVHYWRSHYAF